MFCERYLKKLPAYLPGTVTNIKLIFIPRNFQRDVQQIPTMEIYLNDVSRLHHYQTQSRSNTYIRNERLHSIQ